MASDHAHGPSTFVTRHVRLALLLLGGGAISLLLPASRQTVAVLLVASVAAHIGGAILVMLGLRWAVLRRAKTSLREHAHDSDDARNAHGKTIRWATLYDTLVSALSFGGEGTFRRDTLALANVSAGERVLDVGCGTGTLALEAKRVVGPTGVVHGVDYGTEMIARARMKAERDGLAVQFDEAKAQSLPFPDASFDVVLCTLMLHHLPASDRALAIAEAHRVLRPGGRLLVVDLGRATGLWAALDPISLVHGRQGLTTTDDAAAIMRATKFRNVQSAPLGARALAYALGVAEA
jgi:ubiquinone/menaquinone biosynthesis C-methylase UbiE